MIGDISSRCLPFQVLPCEATRTIRCVSVHGFSTATERCHVNLQHALQAFNVLESQLVRVAVLSRVVRYIGAKPPASTAVATVHSKCTAIKRIVAEIHPHVFFCTWL